MPLNRRNFTYTLWYITIPKNISREWQLSEIENIALSGTIPLEPYEPAEYGQLHEI